ncbi:MAG: hypothetical protein JSR15_09990 [Proteobacteria bacterium]|nr:hypothetical protein [Pseudomonadota bacterium]
MMCRGQAMVEFAVAAGTLALLLLCMPVLCRYHELQVASIEAARRVAFESSWRAGGAGGLDTASIRAALFPDVGDAAQVSVDRIQASADASAEPGAAGQSERALLLPFRVARLLSGGFDLQAPHLRAARLAVRLTRPEGLPDPFSQVPIEFNERYALVGNDWASGSPGQVADRAGGLVFSRAVPPVRALVQWSARLLSVFEPALRQLCLGQVDPERVPADRLGVGVDPDASPPTQWSPSC